MLLISLLIVPIIIFAVRPQAPCWQRDARLVICVLLAWAILFGTTYLEDYLQWQKAYRFRAEFPQCEFKPCENEPHLSDYGPRFAFIIVFGWMPAIVWTGCWELLWQFYHRRVTKQIDSAYAFSLFNRLFAFVAMLLSVILFIYILLLLIASIYIKLSF